MQRNLAIKAILVFCLIILGVSLYFILSDEYDGNRRIAGTGDAKTTGLRAADIGGNFTLLDHEGHQFDTTRLQGRMRMIYFGFSYCPDICPKSLEKLSVVMNAMDKYGINIKPLFVSIDPSRDTPETLKDFISHYHPEFTALTGTKEMVKKVADQYKVFYLKTSEQDNYMVDHSSFVYIMDERGRYLKHFYLNSEADEIINFIRISAKKDI